MRVLVVGGSSGLGLALSKELSDGGNEVIVTGRHDPKVDFAKFMELDLSPDSLPGNVEKFVVSLPQVDCLVYAAGSYPFGRVTDLSPEEIEASLAVAGRGLIYVSRSLLLKQGKIDQVIVVTSMGQWVAKEKEVVYSFVKAGAGHFSNSLSLDSRVGKVLVAGPAMMKNGKWGGARGDREDESLDKSWVAQQILKAGKGEFGFKSVKILNGPPRVEVAEKR